MPLNYLSTGKKAHSFLSIVFSVAEAIVEKLFLCEKSIDQYFLPPALNQAAQPPPPLKTPSRNRTYFLDMPGRRFDEKDNIELIMVSIRTKQSCIMEKIISLGTTS